MLRLNLHLHDVLGDNEFPPVEFQIPQGVASIRDVARRIKDLLRQLGASTVPSEPALFRRTGALIWVAMVWSVFNRRRLPRQ